jgi:hypothetical protein
MDVILRKVAEMRSSDKSRRGALTVMYAPKDAEDELSE